jgi:hypothetical protein
LLSCTTLDTKDYAGVPPPLLDTLNPRVGPVLPLWGEPFGVIFLRAVWLVVVVVMHAND